MSLFCFLPLLLIWIKYHKKLNKNRKFFTKTPFSFCFGNCVGLFCDSVWCLLFNEEKILGVYLINIPIEDILWIISVPY
jgi:hypothetical protein